MHFDESKTIQLQTNATRDKVEALLEGLLDAQHEAQRNMTHTPHETQYIESSRQSLQRAIDSARKMIHQLNQAMKITEHDLDAPDPKPLEDALTSPREVLMDDASEAA